MRISLLLALVPALAGCSTYYDASYVTGAPDQPDRATFTYDRRLPNAIEDVFHVCHGGELELTTDFEAIDVRGDCAGDVSDLDTEAGTLIFGMNAFLQTRESSDWTGHVLFGLQEPQDIVDEETGEVLAVCEGDVCTAEMRVPAVDLVKEGSLLEGLQRRMAEGCEITADVTMEFLGFGWNDLDASWADGGLLVHLDPDGEPALDVSWTNVDVDCDRFRPAVQAVVAAVSDGSVQMTLDGLTVDASWPFEKGAGGKTLWTEVEVSAGDDPAWSMPANTSGLASVLAEDLDASMKALGMGPKRVAGQLRTGLESGWGSLPGVLEPIGPAIGDWFTAERPAGYSFCSMTTTSNNLVIRLGDGAPGTADCQIPSTLRGPSL